MQVTLAYFGVRMFSFVVLLPVSPAFANTCVEGPPLKPVRCICGIVNNQLGESIRTAKLTLLKNGMELKTTQADSDGRFEFGRVEAGNYEFRPNSTVITPRNPG